MTDAASVARLAALQDRAARERGRAAEAAREAEAAGAPQLDERGLVRALADFDKIWDALAGKERVQLVQLLVEKVTYNAATSSVSISFRPSGLESLIFQTP
jgi:site-specific DNA recombinase